MNADKELDRIQVRWRKEMKYILLMNSMRVGAQGLESWSDEDAAAHIAYWTALNTDLANRGEFVGVEVLTGPGQAVEVRAGQDGLPITDGVFPETKEILAGFWVVDVETPERAYAIAAQASAAPGQGGVPLNMPIEVRQIMTSIRPEDLL
jgi:hypothetical protein